MQSNIDNVIFQLKSINSKHDHSKELFVSFFILVCYHLATFMVVLICREILLIFKIVHSIPVRNYLYLASIICSGNSSIVSLYVLVAAKTRFKLINRILGSRTTLSFEQLKSVSVLHDKLYDTISLINKCYSISFLIHISQLIVRCVLLMFDGYMVFFKNNSLAHQFFFYSGIIFSLPEATFTLSIIVQSALLKMEANKSFNLLNGKTLSSYSDDKTLKLVHLFGAQISHRNPAISCGLFMIDWKFLFAFISSCLSNLIILFQFDVSGSY